MNYIVTLKDNTVTIMTKAELDKAVGVIGKREIKDERCGR